MFPTARFDQFRSDYLLTIYYYDLFFHIDWLNNFFHNNYQDIFLPSPSLMSATLLFGQITCNGTELQLLDKKKYSLWIFPFFFFQFGQEADSSEVLTSCINRPRKQVKEWQ